MIDLTSFQLIDNVKEYKCLECEFSLNKYIVLELIKDRRVYCNGKKYNTELRQITQALIFLEENKTCSVVINMNLIELEDESN